MILLEQINRELKEQEEMLFANSELVIASGKRKGICPNCSAENTKPILQRYSSCKNCNQDLRWR